MSGKNIWNNILIGVLFLLIITPHIASAQPSTIWTRTFDSTGDDEAYSVEIGDDGYLISGITNSNTSAQYDVWLIKTDKSGAMEWNQTYGGSQNDVAFSMIGTDDNGYVLAGGTSSSGAGDSDVWLVKVDGNGNMEWNKTYGGPLADNCWSIIITGDGGYALLCTTNAVGVAGSDVWLLKVDDFGNLQWNQTYGGTGTDSVSTIIQTDDCGYALACSTTSFGAGSADFWLIKVDSYGNVEWNQTYGWSGVEYANSLVATKDGGYALTGSTSSFGAGSADVWLVKIDSMGNIEWNQTYGGPLADYCESMVSSDGDFTLGCITQTPTFGDGSFWLARVDSLGNLQWNRTYGESAHHSHTSLVTTADGSFIFGGSTRDNLGKRDFWLAKIGESQGGSDYLIYFLMLTLISLIVILIIFIHRTRRTGQ